MEHRRVPRPLLVFDGECGFCKKWIAYWKTLTGDRVDYAPFQEIAPRFSNVPERDFRRAVQIFLPDGTRFSGARAVFRAIAEAPGEGWRLWCYERLPLVAPVTEAAYRFVARRRVFAARATRLLWGKLEKPEFVLARWLFLRAVGVLSLIAFLSYFVQLPGLIGAEGILPAARYLETIRGHAGTAAYWYVPTLAWFWHSDLALQAMALAGIAASLLVIADAAVIPALVAIYVLYLSLLGVGGDFLAFQWDGLTLEMAFLSLFLAPWKLAPGLAKESRPSRAARWLFWLLLFRFMVNSGAVKLLSGDPNWRNLTALKYHFFSQPIPNPLSWYMSQLPLWSYKLLTFGNFFVELAVPFLIFAPRRLRIAGAWAMIAFQAVLQATGNYTAFNMQAIALCILLFDDQFLRRFFPKRMAAEARAAAAREPKPLPRRVATAGVAGVMLFASALLTASMVLGEGRPVLAATSFYELIAPFHIMNVYGPFAIMTTTRPEVIVEGSDDGTVWKEYGFRYKVGDVMRAPPIIAPHHPRLDWEMWFLQFGQWQDFPWFSNFMYRLLQGSPDVLALLGDDPFRGAPPKYVRALLYDYRFTTPAERDATGAWWVRTYVGEYFPKTSLDDFRSP